MTKHRGVIRIEKEPFEIIKWFTKNYNHEIGALGVGKVKNGEMIVEKLAFPTQIVNGVHVHFEPKDWASVIKELTEKELQNIIFYWHKHPDNCPGASDGDEQDTFDVFMCEEAKRKIFGFLQTSNTKTGMEYEARIELRHPIRTSITDVKIVTTEEKEIEKKCQKILEEKISYGTKGASDQPGVNKVVSTFQKTGKSTSKTFNSSSNIHVSCNGCGAFINIANDDDFDSGLANGFFCKECAEGLSLEDALTEETTGVTFEVSAEHGNVILKHSEYLGDWIDQILEDPDIGDLVKNTKKHFNNDTVIRKLQPQKKKIWDLYNSLKTVENEMFVSGETKNPHDTNSWEEEIEHPIYNAS